MGKEIEHKYIVTGKEFIDMATESHNIKQGYLCKDKERTIRIRIMDTKAFVTIKGETHGDTRAEYEYPIPLDDAMSMMDSLCINPIIEKTRYIVPFKGNNWEVDMFKGFLDGLILAEIEIPSSEYKYDIPPFVGKNVTNDARYYNSNLVNGNIPDVDNH